MKQIGQSIYDRALSGSVQMTLSQSRIMKSKSGVTIRANPNPSQLADVLRNTSEDLGCVMTPMRLMRLVEFVTEKYSHLTIDEISIAFEMLVLGELDDKLTDGRGNVNKLPFNNFTTLYTASILNAYIEHAQDLIAPILGSIAPLEDEPITIEESKRILSGQIIELANEIRMGGNTLHRTMYIPFFYNWFVGANLVEALTEVTADEIKLTGREMRMNGSVSLASSMAEIDRGAVSLCVRKKITDNIHEMFRKFTSEEIAMWLTDYANQLQTKTL